MASVGGRRRWQKGRRQGAEGFLLALSSPRAGAGVRVAGMARRARWGHGGHPDKRSAPPESAAACAPKHSGCLCCGQVLLFFICAMNEPERTSARVRVGGRLTVVRQVCLRVPLMAVHIPGHGPRSLSKQAFVHVCDLVVLTHALQCRVCDGLQYKCSASTASGRSAALSCLWRA